MRSVAKTNDVDVLPINSTAETGNPVFIRIEYECMSTANIIARFVDIDVLVDELSNKIHVELEKSQISVRVLDLGEAVDFLQVRRNVSVRIRHQPWE